ncbi:MAG: hypothetical protein Q9217_001965, partial [Psora testacea]
INMAITFYHVPYSTSNATSAVLAELEHNLGVPLCTRVELSIQAGDTRAASFLANVNPNGRVPVIVHDGVPIWESAAITMYLGEMFGVDDKDKNKDDNSSGHQLYPALGPLRGEAMKWIIWTNLTIAEAGSRLAAALPTGHMGAVEEGSAERKAELERSSGSPNKEAEAKTAKEDLVRWLGILNCALEGREYLLGKEYCLADTHVWTFVRWLTFMGVALGSFGNVEGWMGKIRSRPALKEEMSIFDLPNAKEIAKPEFEAKRFIVRDGPQSGVNPNRW